MNQTSLDRKYSDLSEAATRCVLRYCQKFSREENFVVRKNREIFAKLNFLVHVLEQISRLNEDLDFPF